VDTCPTALFELLKSDLYRSLDPSEIDLIESDCSLVGFDSARLLAIRAQLNAFLKKYQEDAKSGADSAALDLFLHWNSRCKDWRAPKADELTDRQRTTLGEFRSLFLRCFELPDGGVVDLSDQSPMYNRPGPGSSIGAKLTDFYTKICAGPLTTTSSDLYWEYYSSILPFELEHEAELARSSRFGSPVVRGSKLGFAPKNRDISRTRCTEPNLNMYYQLGTGMVIEGLIERHFGIRLDDQPDFNRELSRIGSFTQRFGTIDLKSASDATSLGMWYWLMPYPEVRNWLLFIRSKETMLPNGTWVPLHLLSSMGNGFTFPLMTLIFACVVEACYKMAGIPMIRNRRSASSNKPGNFGVFGDDIIVDTKVFAEVCDTLKLLGYEVNTDKSFGAGPFRESCGTDWFLGQNVRAVYCKRLKRPQHRYALINRLNAWSAEWDLPLPATINALLKTVWWLPVPPWEDASSGVVVPFDHFRVRDLDEYGGFVYHGLRPIVVRWKPERGLTERHDTRKGDIACPSKKPNFVNEAGVILAAVRGYLRDGFANCRDDNVKFRKTRLTTPGWGFNSRSECGFSTPGWARFEKYLAQLNLDRSPV